MVHKCGNEPTCNIALTLLTSEGLYLHRNGEDIQHLMWGQTGQGNGIISLTQEREHVINQPAKERARHDAEGKA